jgi:hypothetical protein
MDPSSEGNPHYRIQHDAILFPAFLTFVLSIPVFGVAMGVGEGTSELLGYVIWGVGNFVLCFFMVRKYPKSAWVIWFPPNLMIVFAAFVEPAFWRTDMWKVEAGVIFLSILGAGLGVVLKMKAAQLATNSSLSSDQ